MLELRNVSLRFGGISALKNVAVTVRPGSIHAVIGPNGAGKTSAFNVLSGFYRPSSGSVWIGELPLADEFSRYDIIRVAACGLLAGIAGVMFFNAETLWQAAVIDNASRPEGFSYLFAIREWLRSAIALSGWSLWGPLLGIGILASISAWSSIRRNRVTPEIAHKKGIARTFQNIRLFADLSARENVMVGMFGAKGLRWSLLSSLLKLPPCQRQLAALRERADRHLAQVGLLERADERAGDLPYGLQRRLEIARALASEPQVLLLDEPAAGLNPREGEELAQLIKGIRDLGITILLIEHHMDVVMQLAETVTVLNFGEKLAEGNADYIQNDPRVLEAYLGTAK